MAEMRKIINQTLGTNDKMVMFRWIAERIATQGVHATWVAGGISDSQQIKKASLNFKGKVWWTLAHHRLYPTKGDDVLSLVCTTVIESFTAGNAFDVGEFLALELRDWVVRGQKALLAYPCMIKQI